jgi:TRAP-type mannitol/chloroaromatic compound transport system substrate-binding protein
MPTLEIFSKNIDILFKQAKNIQEEARRKKNGQIGIKSVAKEPVGNNEGRKEI